MTENNYGHYGNAPGDPRSGGILLGLMNGLGAVQGFAYQIGDLDVAILADTGLGTRGDDVLDLPFLPAMRGGAGRDVLIGGIGADSFAFNLAPVRGQRMDLIKDFRADEEDGITLKIAAFAAAGPAGMLAEGAFYAAPGATRGQDANDRILYDTETGKLSYDPDGDGPLAASGFALLRGAPTLAAHDIWLVA